tara:strand:+ start:64 stop:300 length:237 start_codon:yes stop_codon:yes gene_type:complete
MVKETVLRWCCIPSFFLCSLFFCRLDNNQIGDEGCRHLADALKTNYTLTDLRYVWSMERGEGKAIGETVHIIQLERYC